jgi:pimeloyl-ACP methyl ester carboxylesterase
MRPWIAWTIVVAVCLGSDSPLHAQTLVGTWQIELGNRQVAKFSKTPNGRLHGEYYNLGPESYQFTRNGNPISNIEVNGRHVRFAFDEQDLSFDGELSADGNSLTGVATKSGQSFPPSTFHRATAKTAWVIDPSPHKVLFVSVEKGVRLEVLDWGGKGPPLIFLAGNGDTAHVFDDFAPKFTDRHHVYAITRRGFGVSSMPEPNDVNYDADRLGDDVLAVIDALKLDRPVIAGHSMGGEELSSIGTRHPERVSGLIYLEAGYEYALYNPKEENTSVDASTMRRDLAELMSAPPSEQRKLIAEVNAMMPALQRDLEGLRKLQEGASDGPPPARRTPRDRVEDAISISMRKYTGAKAPALAIYASPHACTANCDSPEERANIAYVASQAAAFEAAVPTAHVVRIAGAGHFVFRSNEAQVMKEMNAFMDGLR